MSRMSMLFACSVSGLFAVSAHAATLVNLDHQSGFDLSRFQKISSTSQLGASNNPNALKQLIQSVDRNGTVHTRYQQYFRGIPIWGHQVITHAPVKGTLSVGGTLVQDLDNDVPAARPAPDFDAKAALKLMQQRYADKMADVIAKVDLLFGLSKAELVYYIDNNQQAHLAYAVNFLADSARGSHPASPYYIVDANTRTVLDEWDDIKFDDEATGPGGNERTGFYSYGDVKKGATYGFLDVTCHSNTCVMENPIVKTSDMYGLKIGPGFPYHFTGTDHEGTDQINGAISPLNDAHFFGSVVFNMYKDWYKTSPVDGQLKLHTHYGTNFENAFYLPIVNSMSFGDGADHFYPLVSLDVLGHEVSHGFTAHHSGLSGKMTPAAAINEAFSDMAGKTAEFYMRGHNGWGVGEDIVKAPNQALRYMDEPTKDGHSIDDARKFFVNTPLDPHYACGVYNKAFYTLATSPGWDTHKAFDVFEAADDHYWQPKTDFVSGAEGVVHAARDLQYSVADVIKAFDAVGIACANTNPDPSCQLKSL